jgi:hypothetical protein
MKNAVPAPSTNAISEINQNTSTPSAMIATSKLTATTRTASAPTRIHFRSQRSATTPAGSAKSACGIVRAKRTKPALVAEPVRASTSSGYAIDVNRVPMLESSCPVWSSMKSRFRRRGTAFTG